MCILYIRLHPDPATELRLAKEKLEQLDAFLSTQRHEVSLSRLKQDRKYVLISIFFNWYMHYSSPAVSASSSTSSFFFFFSLLFRQGRKNEHTSAFC